MTRISQYTYLRFGSLFYQANDFVSVFDLNYDQAQLDFSIAACTCPGESHPGPVRSDGSYVGRSAPEIDVVEATIIDGIPYVGRQIKLTFKTWV